MVGRTADFSVLVIVLSVGGVAVAVVHVVDMVSVSDGRMSAVLAVCVGVFLDRFC